MGFAYQEISKLVLRGGYGLFNSKPNPAILFNSSTGQPWSLVNVDFGPSNGAQGLANPFQTLPDPSAFPMFTPYTANTVLSFTAIERNFRPAFTQVFSLGQQYSVTRNLLFELGYVGARSVHLGQGDSPNVANFATPSAPIRGITTNTVANVQQRVPVEGFGATAMSYLGSEGASWYHGLQATFTQRAVHHLQYQVAYTWAKTTDTAAPDPGNDTMDGDPHSRFRRYGAIIYDRRQRVTVNYSYDLPTMNSKTLASYFINGWGLTGDTTLQAGTPVELLVTNGNVYSGETNDFANVSCPASGFKTSGTKAQKVADYINLSCITPFPVVDPSGATGYGNGPVSPFTGPGQYNFDMALAKHTAVHFPNESANVEFRVEAFNLFNHTQFNNPLSSGSAAPPAGATQAQAAKALGGSFGPIVGTSVSPRVLQLALKYVF